MWVVKGRGYEKVAMERLAKEWHEEGYLQTRIQGVPAVRGPRTIWSLRVLMKNMITLQLPGGELGELPPKPRDGMWSPRGAEKRG